MEARRHVLPSPSFLFLLIGALLCLAVYYPGLSGDFIFDDYSNIVQNGRLQVDEISARGVLQAILSADSGMLKRPVSMFTFWLNYYTTGLDPFYFKLTNLAIHLLNGLGLFWLTRLLLPRLLQVPSETRKAFDTDFIAAAVAVIWLLHPLNLTGVLYVVQRMTSLSATFVILGLLCYVLARERILRRERGFLLMFVGVAAFGALATFTKENGALLALYIAVIELCAFKFRGPDSRTTSTLKLLHLGFVAAPLAFVATFLILNPEWIADHYLRRPFTLTERLLTEARVLWMYLGWLVVPRRADFGLFHDDVAISKGLFDPPTTIVAISGIAVAWAIALLCAKRAPLATFAVGWYFAGHVLESSVIGLELVFEHRNYLPAYGPLLLLVVLAARATEHVSPRLRLAAPTAFALLGASVTLARSLDWRDPHTLATALVRYHPESARANYEAGISYGMLALANPDLAPQLYERIKSHMERAAALDENAVNPLFALVLLDATNGREIDDALLARLAKRLSNMPLNFTTVEAFRSLVDWTTEGVVVLCTESVLALFEAALGNPSGDSRTRATLLALLSAYYYNVLGDPQQAASLALAATQEDPSEPVHHLSVADLAIKLGNLEVATRELELARQKDPLGEFTLQADELARSLREAEEGT